MTCNHESISYYEDRTKYMGNKVTFIPANSHFCDDCEEILLVSIRGVR